VLRPASRRTPHAWAMAHARPEFSMCTGRPVSAASRSRSGKSRQPSLGANEMLAPSRSTMPGTTRPMPSHWPRSLWSSRMRRSRAASVLMKRPGSDCVAKLDTPMTGSLSRSVTM